MKTTLTAQTISFDQIRSLRTEAAEAGDFVQVAMCDLALNSTIDTDDYTTLDRGEVDRVRSMSREDAYTACASAINEAVQS
jgi:hypothetical protein